MLHSWISPNNENISDPQGKTVQTLAERLIDNIESLICRDWSRSWWWKTDELTLSSNMRQTLSREDEPVQFTMQMKTEVVSLLLSVTNTKRALDEVQPMNWMHMDLDKTFFNRALAFRFTSTASTWTPLYRSISDVFFRRIRRQIAHRQCSCLELPGFHSSSSDNAPETIVLLQNVCTSLPVE